MADATAYCDAHDETRGTDANEDGDLLQAREIQDVSVSSTGHCYMAVENEIGEGSTITAAVFKFYQTDYTKTGTKPLTADEGHINIYNGDSPSWFEIFSFAIALDDGWNQVTLDSDARNLIMSGWGSANHGVGHDTEFRFQVDNPGAGRSRVWEIASWDNDGGGSAGDWACYLELTYTPAGGGGTRVAKIRCS